MGIDTLQDFRDVTIISFTIAGTVLFLIAIILTIVIGGLRVATGGAAVRAFRRAETVHGGSAPVPPPRRRLTEELDAIHHRPAAGLRDRLRGRAAAGAGGARAAGGGAARRGGP